MSVFDPSVYSPDVFEAGAPEEMSASGSFVLTGAAQLQLTVTFDAAGAFAMVGAAALTTEINMAAAGEMVFSGEAALRAAKTGRVLAGCGHVLAADCDQWVIAPFL